MKTKLDQLLDSIHPTRTSERLQRRADTVLNGLRIRSNLVDDAIRFRDILCRFVQQLDSHLGIVPTDVSLPRDVVWQRACELLRSPFGQHGESAAFEIAQTGAEGGLHSVLRRVAAEAVRLQQEKEVRQRVESFCRCLSAEQYLAAGAEYIEKHGRLLPQELRTGFAGRARLNLAELLKRHHMAMANMASIGRT